MRTGRPKQALILTDEERDRLQSLAVARKMRASLGMVGKWRSRFLKARLEGLYDEPRPGAPRQVSDAQVEQVVIQTLESTPRGQTHWSTRGLATGGDSDLGKHAPRTNPLEHARLSHIHRLLLSRRILSVGSKKEHADGPG